MRRRCWAVTGREYNAVSMTLQAKRESVEGAVPSPLAGHAREPARGGSVAALMPPHGPAIGENTASES